MKKQNQGFAYWIPAKLVEGGDHLKALLYGLIYSLTDTEGKCWAGNEFLAKKLGRKDKSIISNKLQELSNEGYILIKNTSSRNREIFLTVGNNQRIPLEITNGQPLEITNASNTTESNVIESNTPTKVGGKEIGEIIDIFKKSINPTISFNHKTYRSSAIELIKQHGFNRILNAAKFAVLINGEPFAPVIGNPYQLKLKWPELLAFKKKTMIPAVGMIPNE